MTTERIDPAGRSKQNRKFPQQVGRDYCIDSLDVAGFLIDEEGAVLSKLEPADKARGAGQNISGIADYAMGSFKVDPSPRITFSKINAFLKEGELRSRYHKRLGILYFNEEPTGFDLVNGSSGEIIIPRGTSVVELSIPRVSFSGNRNEVVTSGMISRSLELVADYISLRDRDLNSGFVIGLTHPRMGKIAARRWGFVLEEQPFPIEVYELLDRGINTLDESLTPNIMQSLEAFRRQVLVYQTNADFINNLRLRKPV